jgi:catechol 2,3-dioxygenase-like lactoylglutathione lyase family enzyme
MVAKVSMTQVAPILPTRDVATALAHYRKLGFAVRAYGPPADASPEYGFVYWGEVQLHLCLSPDHDPKTTASCCYLYVSDADALHAAWAKAHVAGRLGTPHDTPYGLREFGHVDPEGNLLRVGSPLKKQA